MFQRTLLKVPTTKEPPQRKTLFRTTCKVSGKVCRVIMDSGSMNNLAPTEMVNKLGLKKLPHPYPYKVFWLSKEQQALVSQQVSVDFQIGEYRDKILCDVAEMDACHLLLGRPWQYDVDSRHDGRKNVYKLTKDGVQYTYDSTTR